MKTLLRLLLILSVAACAKARVIQNFNLRQSKVVIAHRGASGALPEHTKEALILAHGMGSDFIEVDIVASKDGSLFVLHDTTLEGTTNVKDVFPKRHRKDGRFYAVDFKASELKSLRVHERVHPESGEAVFPERFPVQSKTHFTMPTLSEMVHLLSGLNQARKKKTGLYLEIKDSEFHQLNKVDVVNLVVNELQVLMSEDQKLEVIVESFNPEDLKRLKNDFKVRYPLVQLIGENSWNEARVDYTQMMTEEGIQAVATYADGIGPWIYQLLRPESDQVVVTDLARFAKKSGLFIHSYTARSDSLPPFAKDYNNLMELLILGVQVDGVFTDQPDLANKFLQNYSVKVRESN